MAEKLLLSTENILKRREALISQWIQTKEADFIENLLNMLASLGTAWFRPGTLNPKLPSVQKAIHDWLSSYGLKNFDLIVSSESITDIAKPQWGFLVTMQIMDS